MSGSGPAVVLAHGAGLSGTIWRGLGYARALVEDFQVITVDLRGHGRSDRPVRPKDYRMRVLAGDVASVLDELGIETAHYLGYSLGGRIGFELLDSYPHRVLSFTSIGGTYRTPPGSVAEAFFPTFDRLLETGDMTAFVREWREYRSSDVDAETAAAFINNSAPALRALLTSLEAEPAVDEQRLAAVDVPSLLMAGTLDETRWRDAHRAIALMQRATFYPLNGQNHASSLRPVSEILSRVIPFLHSID